jgi:HEAT repeat protein
MCRLLVFLTVLAQLTASAPSLYGQKPQESAKDEEAKLIAVLKSDAPRKAKADACRELARVGSRESVAPLAALLCNEELSHMARYGLEPIPDPAVDTALRDTVDKVNGQLLVGVICSIGVRRDPKAVAALVKRLDDKDDQVVQAAARALGRIGTIEVVAPLEKALASTAQANRIAVSDGLFRCADVLRSQGERKEAQAIYEQLGKANVPEYVKTGAKHAEQTLQPRTRERTSSATPRTARPPGPGRLLFGELTQLDGLATTAEPPAVSWHSPLANRAQLY